MSSITIKGQAGKSLDDVERSFSEIAPSGTLSFQSMAPDRLTFDIEPDLITAKGSIIPDIGQAIELFIDGKRHFSGVVTSSPARLDKGRMSITITVEGPFWNLESTSLTDIIPSGGEEIERPQFRCPKGNVRDHIIRLLQRAKALGVPVDIGAIAECYDCPTITFRDGSFGYALAELSRLVPDSVAWFDYSGAGNPKFNLSRRDVRNPFTITLGADDVASVDLSPDLDLKVERVSVASASRAQDGSIQYRSQEAGSHDNNARQIVTVSGPELAEILPPDPLESSTVTTEAAFSGSSLRSDAIKKAWKLWVETELSTGTTTGFPLAPWGSFGADDARYDQGVIPKYYLKDGAAVLSSDPATQVAFQDDASDVPPWLPDQNEGVSGSHKGTWYLKRSYVTGSTIWSQLNAFERVMWQNVAFSDTWIEEPSPGVFVRYLGMWFNLDFTFSALPSAVSSTTFWQAPAYTFEAPPSDYAVNLLDAQSFLPYSGGVDLQLQPGGFRRRSGATLNIQGGLKPWESMGALVQGESLDLESGLHSFEVGVPRNRSLLNSISFIKRDPGDNVILL